MTRVRALFTDERGYSMIELLVVTMILTIIVGALTTLFVGASKSELDMNRRFQAQENARLAIDKLRREVHCASGVSPSGSSSSIVLTIPSQCPTAQGFTSIRWCVLPPPGALSGRYALYRSTAATCTTATGVKWADYLKTQSIFTYTVQSTASLGSLAVALVVNTSPGGTHGTVKLNDSIVLRNSSRTCITGSPLPC
jgi:prepilin-type N-terminal cleavage/methylation domain-containing protein